MDMDLISMARVMRRNDRRIIWNELMDRGVNIKTFLNLPNTVFQKVKIIDLDYKRDNRDASLQQMFTRVVGTKELILENFDDIALHSFIAQLGSLRTFKVGGFHFPMAYPFHQFRVAPF